LVHRDAVSIATIMAIAEAIVEAVAEAVAHRLTAPRRLGARRRPFRDDPEDTEFRLERWCSIGKTSNAGA
jgi:hypothetical protein